MDLHLDRLGTKTETGGRYRLDYDRLVDAPLETVWRSLVDPVEAAAWWGVQSVTIIPGERYLLHGETMPPGGPIVAWDPPRLLSFEWNRDETDTAQVITFRLEAAEERTRLHFSHEGLLPHWTESVLPGWHCVLLALAAHLAGAPYDGEAAFAAVAPAYGAMRSAEEYRERGRDYQPPLDVEPSRMGTVEITHHGRHTTLRFERYLEAPPSAVWRLLTDPAEVAIWMNCHEVTIDPGVRIAFHFRDSAPQGGAIRRWEPEACLAFEWDDHYPRPGERLDPARSMSLVTFELRAEGEGTRLVLLHTEGEPREARDNLGGWHGHLVALREALAGRSVDFERLFAATRDLYRGGIKD